MFGSPTATGQAGKRDRGLFCNLAANLEGGIYNDLGDHSFPPEEVQQGTMIQQQKEAQTPPWKDGAGLGRTPVSPAMVPYFSLHLKI